MVRPRVRVHPGVAAAAVQGLQLLQLQIQGPIILVLSVSYYLSITPVDFCRHLVGKTLRNVFYCMR